MTRRKRFISRLLCFLLILQVVSPFFGGNEMKALARGKTTVVSFQPVQSPVSKGTLADHGAVFGVKNNYAYGWNVDHTDTTVTRSIYADLNNKVDVGGSTYGEPILDTLTRIHPDGEWEMQLDNGIYEVAVTVGDSVYSSTNALAVEGISFWEHLSLGSGEHATMKKSVTVEDGKLSLSQVDGPGIETAINRIEISMITMFTPTLAPPRIGLPFEQNKVAGNKLLLSGTMVNVHNAPPFTHVDGLQGEISRHMGEQAESIRSRILQYGQTAVSAGGGEVSAIQQVIASNHEKPTVVKAGQLNLESSVTFGSPDRPVIVILDGINSNQKLTITVYGSLILLGGLNANSQLDINIVNNNNEAGYGNLWAQGAVHLNNNSNVHVDNELYAGSLTYNSGTLSLEAKRVLVSGNMDINTNVTMNIDEEMSVGEIVSNNLNAALNVTKGDLFARDNVSVNNHLSIATGGLFAIGGNLISNQRPVIHTGNETEGRTLLKYAVSGLKAEYFSNADFTGRKMVKVDESIFLSGRPVLGVPDIADQHFSVRWTGQIQPKYSGDYTFSVNTNGGVRLWVNDQLLVEEWTAKSNSAQGVVSLEAGMKYDIRMEYANDFGNPQASLLWQSDEQIQEVVPSLSLRPFAIPSPAASAAENAISLQWPSLFNADGYEVEFDGNMVSLGTEALYVADNLDPGTLHSYRVRANSEDLKGAWSLTTPFWTLPAVPRDIRLTSTSQSITLIWTPVTGATSYEVEVNNSIQNIGNVTTYQEVQLNPNMQKAFRIRARNSSGPGGWSEVIAKTTIVAIPSNLTGIAEENSIKLQWDAVSGAIAYDLEADGVVIGNVKDNVYLHNKLEANSTHKYRVRAHNENGISQWSDKITVYTPPAVPDNLKAKVAGDTIHVSWDEVTGATGYDLEVDGTILNNKLKTQYTHAKLNLNSEHTYRVRAKNVNATGGWTSLVVYTTHAGTPNNVQTSATSSDITITWDVVAGAVGYDLEVDGAIIQSGKDNTYIHRGLAPFSSHGYRIRARNAGGTGAWSRLVLAKTTFGKPQNLKAVSYNTSIELTWDKLKEATGYDILVDGEVIENGSAISYKHTGLEPYSGHVYRVRGKYGESLGEWSEPLTKSTVLGIPGNIQIQPQSNQISLSWDSVAGATGYEIEADGNLIDNGGKVNYTHTGLLPNTKHIYRIRAKNAEFKSAWSEWTTAITGITAPGVPQNMKAAATISSIQLTWESVEGATAYDLEADGQIISGIDAAGYKHSGLAPNTMHIYRVRARNEETHSEWSEKLKKITTPEITIRPEKDSEFNLVIIVPQKSGLTERKVTVTYNADDLKVIDLRAETPELEVLAGTIPGTAITVTSFEPGKIIYTVQSSGKTTMNTIKLLALTNEFTKFTYIIE